jgi:hypothetical protein
MRISNMLNAYSEQRIITNLGYSQLNSFLELKESVDRTLLTSGSTQAFLGITSGLTVI